MNEPGLRKLSPVPLLCRFSIALPVLFSALLAGCAYQLGPTNGMAAGSRSIQISQFENQTYEPRLVQAVATALRQALQQDGTYQLATHNNGDVLVTGTLTEYHREPLTFEPRDVLTTRDFRITLVAKVTAVDRASGKTLLEKEVRGRTLVRTGADLASAERQSMPMLAEDLARNIASLLVDGSW